MIRLIQRVLYKLRLPLFAAVVALVAPMTIFPWLWVVARVFNVDPHDPNGEKFKEIRAVERNPYIDGPPGTGGPLIRERRIDELSIDPSFVPPIDELSTYSNQPLRSDR